MRNTPGRDLLRVATPHRAHLVGAREWRRRLHLRHVPGRRLFRRPFAHPSRRPAPTGYLAAPAIRHRRSHMLGVPHNAPERERTGRRSSPRARRRFKGLVSDGGSGGVQGGVLVAAHWR
ncbi:hypothetical protein GUJ93_ZPchr0076g18685 [Zizania palustris]|uniref:Uncharacterized protein n=1 Tax=Zizania palustris TaxID=103762 RepID=A0A8J5QW72_ZIZPA|nr:hypothetical protein GUJ93_ZPchr0076g18685 [Zizania palustris]